MPIPTTTVLFRTPDKIDAHAPDDGWLVGRLVDLLFLVQWLVDWLCGDGSIYAFRAIF